jgi:hypothetical protein
LYNGTLNIQDSGGNDLTEAFTADVMAPGVASISASTDARITDQSPGSFTVTRTGELSYDLEVDYTTDTSAPNSAVPGVQYTSLPGTITIPAGQATATISVIPLADGVGGSDTTVSVALTGTSAPSGSTSCTLAGQSPAVVTIIGSESAEVTIGNLPDSLAESVGATIMPSENVPIEVSVPSSAPAGTSVTLTLNSSSTSEVAVWQQSQGNDNPTLILGGGAGGPTTWTGYVVAAGIQPWQGLSIEAISPSASIRDTVLSIAVQLGSTLLTNQTTATSAELRIDYNGNDITTQDAGKVLVGQKIELVAATLPAGLPVTNPRWSMEGTTFGDYNPTAKSAKIVPVQGGTTVDFYWSAGTSFDEMGNDAVALAADVNGTFNTAETSFDVYRPSDTFTVTQGQVGFRPPTGDPKQFGLFGNNNSKNGMDFTGTVTMPAGFDPNSGEWCFVQKITKVDRNATDADGGSYFNSMNGQSVLDTTWPYEPVSAQSWTTGAAAQQAPGYGYANDNPNMSLLKINTVQPQPAPVEVDFDETVSTYILFRPKGADSRWVPLQEVNWDYKGTATEKGGNWTMAGTNQHNFPPENVAVQPEWTANIKDSRMRPKA